MASISDLPVEDFVIPCIVWVIIIGYYIFQSKRRPKQKMKAGEVTTDHVYYANYFFYVRIVLWYCHLLSRHYTRIYHFIQFFIVSIPYLFTLCHCLLSTHNILSAHRWY